MHTMLTFYNVFCGVSHWLILISSVRIRFSRYHHDQTPWVL